MTSTVPRGVRLDPVEEYGIMIVADLDGISSQAAWKQKAIREALAHRIYTLVKTETLPRDITNQLVKCHAIILRNLEIQNYKLENEKIRADIPDTILAKKSRPPPFMS